VVSGTTAACALRLFNPALNNWTIIVWVSAGHQRNRRAGYLAGATDMKRAGRHGKLLASFPPAASSAPHPKVRQRAGLLLRSMWQLIIVGAPGRAWTAHIVQFGSVRAEGVAGQVMPEGGEGSPQIGKGARQQVAVGYHE
jgi:hypothetical protein